MVWSGVRADDEVHAQSALFFARDEQNEWNISNQAPEFWESVQDGICALALRAVLRCWIDRARYLGLDPRGKYPHRCPLL